MEVVIPDPNMREAVHAVCELVRAEPGGRALLVGGCVRDAVLGRPAEDIDIEVYGVAPERLTQVLGARFRIDLVGAAFGVLKLHGMPVDVSLPRRESKAGLGHRGFEIRSDPHLSYAEAAARRDFTINSMAADPLTGELIDPFRGVQDLEARILRHTSDHFAEDPLRVLRGMQFAARLGCAVAPETVELCRTIEPEGLAQERVFDEWKKLILQGIAISRGLGFLEDCAWIRHYPELEALVGCAQEPDWHPEGDVWVHTLHCMDAFAGGRTGDEREDLVVGFAVLCHDFGKPATTAFEDGRIRSLGHEAAGEAPARAFLGRMTNQADLIDAVVPLVTHHLRPQQYHEAGAGDGAIRRLARAVGRIDRLVRVADADMQGRPGLPRKEFAAGAWLLARAEALAVKDAAPRPIVMGRHLIALGFAPGPALGSLLAACYEAQLDGAFATLDDGIEFARRAAGMQR